MADQQFVKYFLDKFSGQGVTEFTEIDEGTPQIVIDVAKKPRWSKDKEIVSFKKLLTTDKADVFRVSLRGVEDGQDNHIDITALKTKPGGGYTDNINEIFVTFEQTFEF